MELRALVGGRGGVDHPRRRRREQGFAQAVTEHEIGHVVEGKGALDPFGGEAAKAEDRTGIVDQDIDPALLCRDLGRHAFDFCDEHEIGVVDAVRRAGSTRPQSPERGLAARPVAGDQNEPRPHGGKPLCRGLADARRRAGDDAGLSFQIKPLRAHCSLTPQCRPASAPTSYNSYIGATGNGSRAMALRCRRLTSEAIRWSSTFTA
jgi:hypothetical protein